MVKLLYWNSDGLAIWYKRLEKGSFSMPRMHDTDGRIDRRELSLLLEGIGPKKVSRRYIIWHYTVALLIVGCYVLYIRTSLA
jgi:transposase